MRHAKRHPVSARLARDTTVEFAVGFEVRLRAAVGLRAPDVLKRGELRVGPRLVERQELPSGRLRDAFALTGHLEGIVRAHPQRAVTVAEVRVEVVALEARE